MLSKEKKKEWIANLISVASSHAHSDMHKHSLLEFDSLNSGFTYTDSWGLEHVFNLYIDDEDTLNIHLVTVPLAGCLMDDHKSIMHFDTDSAPCNWDADIMMYIDDYCYRDNPVECGCSEPYSLIQK